MQANPGARDAPGLRPITARGRAVVAVACAALTMHIVGTSGFTGLFEGLDFIRTLCIVGTLICSLAGIGFAVADGHLGTATISVALLASIPLEILRFSIQTGVPYAPWSGGAFFPLGLFALFYVVIRQGVLRKTLTFLFGLVIAYALLYAVLSLAMRTGLLHLDSKLIISADDTSGRTARIPLLHGYIAMGFFAAMASLIQNRSRYQSIMLMALFTGCLYLSQSRTIIAVMAATALAVLFVQSMKTVSRSYFFLFCAGLIATLAVCFNSHLNPLDEFGTDISSWARWSDIRIVHSLVSDIWLLGSGISSGEQAFQPLTGVKYFFPGDIGLAGVLTEFGILGVAFYLFIAFAACHACSKAKLKHHYPQLVGILLSGPVLVIYSLLAPVFIAGSGMVSAVIFMAIWWAYVSKGLAKSPRARPKKGVIIGPGGVVPASRW